MELRDAQEPKDDGSPGAERSLVKALSTMSADTFARASAEALRLASLDRQMKETPIDPGPPTIGADTAALCAYVVGAVGTFAYLVAADFRMVRDLFAFFVAFSVDLVLASIWPIYWAALHWLR
jgi:hypothetical protein